MGISSLGTTKKKNMKTIKKKNMKTTKKEKHEDNKKGKVDVEGPSISQVYRDMRDLLIQWVDEQ